MVVYLVVASFTFLSPFPGLLASYKLLKAPQRNLFLSLFSTFYNKHFNPQLSIVTSVFTRSLRCVGCRAVAKAERQPRRYLYWQYSVTQFGRGTRRSTHPASEVHNSPPREMYPGTDSVADFDKTDLASILRDPPIQQHERLSEALQIIHPIQFGPRCHYQAALHLLNDCKFLENSSPDVKANSEASLDDLETVYAARLAVCELMSANAAIPPDCKVVAASKEACIKRRQGFGAWFSQQEQPTGDTLCYPEANPKQFRRCMTAIFGQPQAWMSYSNARQNAVVMCHASRDVIEKGGFRVLAIFCLAC